MVECVNMRRSLIALAFAFVGCSSLVSPTGGGGPGDGGLADGGVTPGLIFDAGPSLYDFAPFLDGGSFKINGQTIATIYWDAGVKTIVFPGPPGKGPMVTILYPDPNHIEVTGDQNSDGVIDYQFSSVIAGNTLTENEQWDHNFDGVFDDVSQRTVTPGDAGEEWLAETESQLIDADGGYELPDAGGSWVVTASYSGPGFNSQTDDDDPIPPTCAGFAGLPENPTYSIPFGDHPTMRIPLGVGSPGAPAFGACPAAYAEHLAIAGSLALDQLYACVGDANAPGDAFNKLAWSKMLIAEQMLANSNTNLFIFCNLACPGKLAGTLVYGTWAQGRIPGQKDWAINLSTTYASWTDEQLGEILDSRDVPRRRHHP